MLQESEIWKELRELESSLNATLPRTSYELPVNYFDTLPERILLRIKTEEVSAKEELAILSPLLSTTLRENPYSIPAGYFEQPLSIHGEEEDKPSFLPADPQETNVYRTPVGYFDTLNDTVLQRVQAETETPVVKMENRKWMRFIAAASIAAVIGVSAFFIINSNAGKKGSGELAQFHSIMKSVDEKSWEDFIEVTQNNPLPVATTDNQPSNDSTEIKGLVQGISDEELQHFLDENTEDTEEDILN